MKKIGIFFYEAEIFANCSNCFRTDATALGSFFFWETADGSGADDCDISLGGAPVARPLPLPPLLTLMPNVLGGVAVIADDEVA